MLLVCFRSPYSGGCEILFCRNRNVIDFIYKVCSVTIVVAACRPICLSFCTVIIYITLLSVELSNSESESVFVSESFQIVSTSLLVYNRFLFALIDYDARQQAIY